MKNLSRKQHGSDVETILWMLYNGGLTWRIDVAASLLNHFIASGVTDEIDWRLPVHVKVDFPPICAVYTLSPDGRTIQACLNGKNTVFFSSNGYI